MARKQAFGAVVDERTRLVIFGSLPGDQSLKTRQYYAHHSNQFWRLASELIASPLTMLPYEQRLANLLAHRVGLWDVIESAERVGSTDAAIREVRANALAEFAASYPNVRAFAFNGTTPAKIGRRQMRGKNGPALIDLPSSSGLNTRHTLARKTEIWLELRRFL
jgi:TDG/mug DNA glycosylase family protein